jgi:hypothetical protein
MADIGIDLTLVEEKLDRLFQLASAWEAVLLFDEADILLEARATEDNITRNSIVSSAYSLEDCREFLLIICSFPESTRILRRHPHADHQSSVSSLT